MDRFATAVEKFDAANRLDPHKELIDGREVAHELLNAKRLSGWVEKLAPNASEPLRLAAHCQHIRRWEIPRASYPEGRAGYLKWREDLKKFHAEKAAEILREVGYDERVIRRVQDLNLKWNLGADPEVQVLEDALCLVFFEHQLAQLAAAQSEEKMIGILQKTWKKMSPRGREIALGLQLGPKETELIQRAL